MTDCVTFIKEIRFVIEEELIQCYVNVDTDGDCDDNIEGWHHKTFSVTTNLLDILKSIAFFDHLQWPIEKP